MTGPVLRSVTLPVELAAMLAIPLKFVFVILMSKAELAVIEEATVVKTTPTPMPDEPEDNEMDCA